MGRGTNNPLTTRLLESSGPSFTARPLHFAIHGSACFHRSLENTDSPSRGHQWQLHKNSCGWQDLPRPRQGIDSFPVFVHEPLERLCHAGQFLR